MPASTVIELMGYETIVENALVNHFTDNVAAFAGAQILTTRTTFADSGITRTPRLTIQCDHQSTGEQRATNADGDEYYCQRNFNLTFELSASRDNSSQSLATMEGAVFSNLLGMTAALNENNLPYYQVITLESNGSNPGTNGENDEVQTTITYEGSLYIKPDQWPTS